MITGVRTLANSIDHILSVGFIAAYVLLGAMVALIICRVVNGTRRFGVPEQLALFAVVVLAALHVYSSNLVGSIAPAIREVSEEVRRADAAFASPGEIEPLGTILDARRQAADRLLQGRRPKSAGAIAARAYVSALDTLVPYARACDTTLERFRHDGTLDFGAIRSRAQAETRRRSAEAYARGNESALKALDQFTTNLIVHIENEGVGLADQLETITMIHEIPHFDTEVKIRRLEGERATAAANALRVLRDHFGRWRAGPAGVTFDPAVPAADVEIVTRTRERLGEIDREQAALRARRGQP